MTANEAFPKKGRAFGECRVCGGECPTKRFTTCSDECRKLLKLVIFPSSQRFYVQKRDRGVCVACGIDTDMLARIGRRMDQFADEPGPPFGRGRYGCGPSKEMFQDIGFGRVHRSDYGPPRLWEMDHIRPVSEGGGIRPDMTVEQILANLQTLCIQCHKAKTAEMRQSQALARRAKPNQSVLDFS